MVDENTAKPIDVRPKLQEMAAGPIAPVVPSKVNSTILIITIVLFAVGLLILIAAVYFVFRNSTVEPYVAGIQPQAGRPQAGPPQAGPPQAGSP
jgi:type IV secretory pathway component VirB8